MLSQQGKEQFLSAYKRHLQDRRDRGPSWLKELRESAIASFGELGFPTTRDEDWKYTSVEPVTSLAFEPANGNAKAVAAHDIFSVSFMDSAYNRLVFVNGLYSPQLSSLRGLPSSSRVESLADGLKRDDGVLQSHLSRYACYRKRSFVALNTAFAEDGAVVLIPKGHILEEPIYLLFVSIGRERPIVSYPRNLIIAEERSQSRVVEIHVGLGHGAYFADAVTEILAADGATLDHYRLQREGESGYHVGTLEAQVGRNGSLSAHSITLGGSWVRNDVHVALNGEGSQCVLNGLYLADGKQHVDNHTEIEHVKPRATSVELYKGILSGAAHGVFNGKILVHKDAQKTDARQTNKNLLLSENVVIHTKPQLEIYADDVKCSHGSTIGQLDRDALFYLRSRGIDLENAQSLLSYAFASDIVSRVKVGPLRARLDDYVLAKFKND